MRKFQNYLEGAPLRKPSLDDAVAHSPCNGATAPAARAQGHSEVPTDDGIAAIEAAVEGAVQVPPTPGSEHPLYCQADCLSSCGQI